jgi:hypothetical protein
MPSAYTKIANFTVPTTSADSIVFSNIPQTYKHLMIQVLWRQYQSTSTWGFLSISDVAGSTASNLYNQYVRWLGGGLNTDTQVGNNMNLFYFNAEGNTSGFFGTGTLFIPDYTNSSKYKTIWYTSTKNDTADNTYAGMGGYGTGQLDQNKAVTSITFSNGAVAGSQITLYGLSDQ